ncbi:small GTP-binding protein [Tritrichomonas foetus]|uniref:Small GTP-binding protein n=1 Tax=Tritrichomonas foetus TaxID=1144522 RepID=A0A1J4KK61_9EUKA|nr:small GTP-binding protein [Tritrichomonas foetus]|eukprot:OHT11687.1 small GTP-binding protein [Tritrichomonas foetus]
MLGHKFDYSLKIVVVGDSGVGKTCLLFRFVRDQWEGETQPTLGVEFLTKVVPTEEHRIQLQLWDTAGQELFRSVTRGYYRGAAGALIVFDLTSKDSFNSVDRWYQDLKEVARSDVITVLIGNKLDLDSKRAVSQEEAQAFADARGMQYFETSAKTGDNVPSAVTACVLQIEKKVNEGLLNVSPNNEPVNFKPNQTNNKEEGCNC